MKNIIFIFLVQIILTSFSYAQLNPLITSWKINTTGETGYMGYTTNVKEVSYSTTSVYVKTNDIADYIPDNAGVPPGVDWWPNNPWFPDSMGYTFRFRLNPQPNVGTPTKPPYGHIGVWSNGVSIYNPLDAKSFNDAEVWFQNAFYWEHLLAETFDVCWGHPNGSHEYHTHQSPACVYDQLDSLNHSPIIGYAFDSYPIYGCYGNSNSDGTGTIKRMKSSYRLRNITDRTTLPDGTVLDPAFYGPTLDSVPLGGYQEDFEYVPGLGDLDEHNGRFSVTAEYPDGIYAYFVTLDASLIPVYPYSIGQTFYGEVIPSDGNMGPNSGFVQISETVTTYLPTSGISEAVEFEYSFEAFPNPASDQVNFMIKSNDLNSILVGEIIDSKGRVLQSGDVATNRNYVFSTSELEAGTYFFRVRGKSQVFNTKFIVSK